MGKNQRLFCSKPFEWFEVTQLNERGGVYLCCPSWLPVTVGDLKSQAVEEIWNSERALEIRRSIHDGSFRYCDRSRCPYLQTESGPVTKADEVQDPALRQAIDGRLARLPYGPKSIICTFDRSCNLSCPSCRSELIVESYAQDEILGIQQKLRKEALPRAEYLHITGSGDPFGSPYFRKWLQTMSRAEMPRLERIHLHTNGILWTSSMWESLPADIRLIVRSTEISIDAARADTYVVNRRGGNFEKLLENLEFIASLRRTGPLQYVKISMVVQENNFREMPDFVRLGKRFGFDVVYFGQLVNWGTFSPEEFSRRAVHFPAHPRHHELRLLIQDPIFEDAIVELGNLTDTRRAGRERALPMTRLGSRIRAKLRAYL